MSRGKPQRPAHTAFAGKPSADGVPTRESPETADAGTRASRTNAGRLLAAHAVPHRLVGYEHDPDAMDAVSVARRIGVEPEILFKTLVVRGDRSGPLVCCIPGPLELDLKKVASISGDKRVSLIAARDLPATTGYERGACSPVGMTRALPTFIDESARLFDEILVSAGVHGAQIRVAPEELAHFIGAEFVDLT